MELFAALQALVHNSVRAYGVRCKFEPNIEPDVRRIVVRLDNAGQLPGCVRLLVMDNAPGFSECEFGHGLMSVVASCSRLCIVSTQATDTNLVHADGLKSLI